MTTSGSFSEADFARDFEQGLVTHCWKSLFDRGRDMKELALIHIEPAGRPEVADLVRAINSEDLPGTRVVGSLNVGWRFVLTENDAVGLLDLTLSEPVRCNLSLRVFASSHRPVLETVIVTRWLAIATVCPHESTDEPPYITTSVNSVSVLQRALDHLAEVNP